MINPPLVALALAIAFLVALLVLVLLRSDRVALDNNAIQGSRTGASGAIVMT